MIPFVLGIKDLSNKVGENIYENVMEGMEFQEEKKEQLGNVREELKERLEEPKAIVNGLRDGVKERLEEPKARMEKLAPKINVEEMKARMEELKAKYEEMAENRTKVGERLVKAFPKMQVRHRLYTVFFKDREANFVNQLNNKKP